MNVSDLEQANFGATQETMMSLGFLPLDVIRGEYESFIPELYEYDDEDENEDDDIFFDGYMDLDLDYTGEDEDYEYFEEEFQDASGRAKRRARRKKRRKKRKGKKTKRKAKRAKRKAKFAKKHPKLAKRLKKRRKLLRKVGRVFTLPGLAPQRGAMLKLIKKNTWQMATDFKKLKDKADAGDAEAKKKWKQKLDRWYGWGGSRKKFKQAIEKGAKKKGSNPKWKKKKGFDGFDEDIIEFSQQDYLEFTSDLEVTHIDEDEYANAAGIITSIISLASSLISKLFKGKKKKGESTGAPSGMDDGSADALFEEAEENEPDFKEQLKYEDENPIPEDQRDKFTVGGFPQWAKIAIGLGVITLIGTIIYYATKKKK